MAFVKKQGAVTLTNTCARRPSRRRPVSAHCTATVANLGSDGRQRRRSTSPTLTRQGPPVHEHRAAGDRDRTGDGVELERDAVSAATAARSIDSITPTVGPDGWLPGAVAPSASRRSPASATTRSPTSTCRTFFYGGEAYTRIGVVSNGYVVVGGGTSGDIVFTPQHFPNAARPNNTLALFWTDLNPAAAGGGAIRVGHPVRQRRRPELDRRRLGGVKNFGNATTHSFELWFQLAGGAAGTGPESEQITI